MSLSFRAKNLTANILNTMLSIGLALIGGSILFLVLVDMINNAYLLTAIIEAFPVIIIGVIIIALGERLSEWLE